MYWPWSVLGLPGPSDPEAVDRAYVQRLEEICPEEDPYGFQALRRAYEAAYRLALVMEQPGEGDGFPTDLGGKYAAAGGGGGTSEPGWGIKNPLDKKPDSGPFLDGRRPDFDGSLSGEGPRRGRGILIAAGILLFLFGIFWLGGWLLQLMSDAPRQRDAQAIMGYLEEDFRVELVSSPHNRDREERRYLYWRADDPDIRFQAIAEGERDTEAGHGGYRTNYTSAMLYDSIRTFAEAWPEYPLWYDLERTDAEGEGASGGSPPAFFLFQLPREGAGDFLTALGGRLERLSQEAWYEKEPPEFLLALFHGDALVLQYHSTEEEIPDGMELKARYESEMGNALLQSLLTDHGVAGWDYPEDQNLLIMRSGEVDVMGDMSWWLTCYGEDLLGEELAMNYYLLMDCSAIYCIPEARLQDEVITLICTETIYLDCGSAVEVYRVE